jgi:predicted ATP-grasp superfamily ATP-dependent carboligase
MADNPARAGAGWPPAVIAGAYQTGVLGVRSLKRRGVRAYMFDCVPTFPGFKSVYGPARLSPDPDVESQQWLEFMVELSREIGARAVLIPSSDKFVTAIARHRHELNAHYLLSPGLEMQGLLADKQTQYALAAQHGMPMQVSRYLLNREDVAQFVREISFPAVLKPTHFREWQKFEPGHRLLNEKLAICRSAAEVLECYDVVKHVTPDVIVQEIIQGNDQSKRVYLSVYDARGERVANAMFRELRCTPIQFGPASVTEPVDDPVTDKVCDDFLRAIGYKGVCEIEMKWDSRDGKVKLIEANPRLSGGGDAAPYAGVDLPWIHYLEVAGKLAAPVRPKPDHFKHIVLLAEATAIPAYWRAGLLNFRGLLSSYRGPRAYFDVDWRDWRYSLHTLLAFTFKLARSLLSRKTVS